MMTSTTTITCDRHGKKIVAADAQTAITNTAGWVEVFANGNRYDLCDECAADLTLFVQNTAPTPTRKAVTA